MLMGKQVSVTEENIDTLRHFLPEGYSGPLQTSFCEVDNKSPLLGGSSPENSPEHDDHENMTLSQFAKVQSAKKINPEERV